MEEKILTQTQVKELGLDKVAVITPDMLEGYTGIGDGAFYNCTGLTSVTIPNSVTRIGWGAFCECTGLTSPVYNAHVFAFMPTAYSGAYTIPDGIESIAGGAFYNCTGLTSLTIPNSVTSIGRSAFYNCRGWTSVIIGNKEYKTKKMDKYKCKAYKAFKSDMTCRGFQYKEDETYELDGILKLCERGFHACLSLADVFNYYYGIIGNDVVVHEVELDGVSNERKNDSKIVAKKITIGKRIL